MQVNAGNAIQGTCNVLRDDGGANLQGRQQDLFFRCNEMVTTFGLGAAANPFCELVWLCPRLRGRYQPVERGATVHGRRSVGDVAAGNGNQQPAVQHDRRADGRDPLWASVRAEPAS